MLAARTEGRDPATRSARRGAARHRRVDDLVDAFIKQHVSKRRSAGEITRILKREIVGRWGARSVHDVTRRDVIELVSEIVDRGAPVAANKTLQIAKTFFTWCVGKAHLDRSPCDGLKRPPARSHGTVCSAMRSSVASSRQLGRSGTYGGIVELLALTAQRREEVAQMTWDELDLEKQVWTFPARERRTEAAHRASVGRGDPGDRAHGQERGLGVRHRRQAIP